MVVRLMARREMFGSGQKQCFELLSATSDLPPAPDIVLHRVNCPQVPRTEVAHHDNESSNRRLPTSGGAQCHSGIVGTFNRSISGRSNPKYVTRSSRNAGRSASCIGRGVFPCHKLASRFMAVTRPSLFREAMMRRLTNNESGCVAV